MPDIFLSYSRDDQPTARRFAEGLERAGFSVWWDATLNPGEAYDQVTEKALAEARAVVVLWSRKSVDSRWVRAEATQANSTGTLVPVMIEACKRPIMFELTHTADLSQWNGDPNDIAWQTFLAGVRRFVEKGSPGPAVASSPTRSRERQIGGRMIAIAVATLLLAGAGLWAFSRKGNDAATPATAIPSTVAASVTLAVLPFVNLSSDPEQEYFSDGLTEEILNQLAQIKALRVTGRTSSFSFKGKNEDLRDIADKLGVANLLEGSVRRDGGSMRITAQLINGKDGAHLWSQTYDRELSKIFAVQEEIAKDVAHALSITLDVGDMNRSQGGSTNAQAYDSFLRGRQLMMKDDRSSSGQAITQFREAVKLDATFSRAWQELSNAMETRMIFVPGEAASLRREIAGVRERVKLLAPDAWWTQLIIANEMADERKWSEARASIDAAVTATAGGQMPLALTMSYLNVMWRLGLVREGLEVGERAMAQDPLALGLARMVQAMLDCAGRPEDAQAEYERIKAQVGSSGAIESWTLARLLMRDDPSAATIKAQMRAVIVQNDSRPGHLLNPLADNFTDRASALPTVRKAFNDPANQDVVALWLVGMLADRFGDKDLALAALYKWTVELKGGTNNIWWPYKTGLRSDPRFKLMVKETGLVDYWRASGNWGDFCKPVGKDDFECQ